MDVDGDKYITCTTTATAPLHHHLRRDGDSFFSLRLTQSHLISRALWMYFERREEKETEGFD